MAPVGELPVQHGDERPPSGDGVAPDAPVVVAQVRPCLDEEGGPGADRAVSEVGLSGGDRAGVGADLSGHAAAHPRLQARTHGVMLLPEVGAPRWTDPAAVGAW